jgi:hypothetical protein
MSGHKVRPLLRSPYLTPIDPSAPLDVARQFLAREFSVPQGRTLVDALTAAGQLDTQISPPAWINGASGPTAHELLICKNGLLHLPSLRLLPLTPNLFAHNAVEFAYAEDAPAPEQWLEFLHALWARRRIDQSASRDIRLLPQRGYVTIEAVFVGGTEARRQGDDRARAEAFSWSR